MAHLKPGPKRIAESTGKPDRRQRDNKGIPGNTPSLKPPKRQEGKKWFIEKPLKSLRGLFVPQSPQLLFSEPILYFSDKKFQQ